MGTTIFIIACIILVGIFSISSNFKHMKKRFLTEDNFPKMDMLCVQCDDLRPKTEMLVIAHKKELQVTSNSYEKTIPYENVVEITIESEESIKTRVGFSMGKAAIGFLALGGIGALVGLAGKTRTKEGLKMMVISYIESDDIKYLIFIQKEKTEKSDTKSEAMFLESACKSFNREMGLYLHPETIPGTIEYTEKSKVVTESDWVDR